MIRMVRLENKDNNRNAYYKAHIDGPILTIRWGRIDGYEAGNRRKAFNDKINGASVTVTAEEQCLSEAMVIIRKKMNKGYVLVKDKSGVVGRVGCDVTKK